MTNIGIHHVWNDYHDEEVDGDDVQDTCIEDTKSKNTGPTEANMEEKTSHNVNDLLAVPETGAAHIVSESHVISPITATPTPSDVTSPPMPTFLPDQTTTPLWPDQTMTPSPAQMPPPPLPAQTTPPSLQAQTPTLAITGTDAAATVTSTDDAAAITGTDNTATITSTDAAAIASPTQPGPVSAHGLVIDYDNSFSLDEIEEFNYRANSVSYFST